MPKSDFAAFEVGTIFNTAPLQHEPILNSEQAVTIDYPARLEAMALDPSKITENNNLVYTAGQIDISVELYKRISVKVLPDTREIIIGSETNRQPLVRHAAAIMLKLFGTDHGLQIDVVDDIDLRHCGLGSSSGLISGTATAINELFGRPLSPLDLCRFTTQNHGEEVDGSTDTLIPVQCIGGSAICGNFAGALTVLAGQTTPIMQVSLPEKLRAVIGVPRDFEHPDSKTLMEGEEANMEGFAQTGAQYGQTIAYRLVHEVMPQLVDGNLQACKDLIFDYRWDMGSIQNCSFVYPGMNELAESLREFRYDPDAKLLSLSSVGPGFFVVTSKPEKFENAFDNLGMQTITAPLNNGTFRREI